jgi:ketosteroid isomerase-like protein
MSLSDRDRLAILDLITRADDAASRRDADSYVALFTEDAVLDGTEGRHVGRDALRAAVGPVWDAEGPVTLHLTLNPVIDPGPDDGRAIARSVLLIVNTGTPPVLSNTAMITQELRRSGDSWRISRRTVAS